MEAVIAYLERVDPRGGRRAPASATLLRPLRREDAQAYGYASRFEAATPVRERGRGAARGAAAQAPTPTCAATGGSPRTSFLRRAERATRTGRRGVLPHDVSRRTSRPGTSATGTWPRPSTRSSSISTAQHRHDEGRRLGAQFARRRCPRDGDGPPGRAQRRPARPPALRHRCVPGRLHDLRRTRHRRFATGASDRSASMCGPRSTGSHEAVLHRAMTTELLACQLRWRLAATLQS